MVAIQSALQVLVLLLLQEVVVVSALCEKAPFDAETVVADSFGHGSDGVFVHGDEVGVFALLVLVGFDERFFLEEFVLEFADSCFCECVSGGGRGGLVWSGLTHDRSGRCHSRPLVASRPAVHDAVLTSVHALRDARAGSGDLTYSDFLSGFGQDGSLLAIRFQNSAQLLDLRIQIVQILLMACR